MGELHLEIYIERMKREYDCEVISGMPQVAYREAVTKRAEFNYLHKKQSGGAGQYGKVVGYMEPLTEEEVEEIGDGEKFIFQNKILGNNIPPEYINAVEKGFRKGREEGTLIGHPVDGVRVVLTDGQAHSVDSSEMAFAIAAEKAFQQGYSHAAPVILEPIMAVEVEAPSEFQGGIVGGLNRRRGVVQNTEVVDDFVTAYVDVPLREMFGYSTELRSSTEGKGEFSMEYKTMNNVTSSEQDELVKAFQEKRNAGK
jgi:elongation factor G